MVTPFAGVWIEIVDLLLQHLNERVTPFAGVWIEITLIATSVMRLPSLPSRECGLKCHCPDDVIKHLHVTPFAGVWIEIS